MTKKFKFKPIKISHEQMLLEFSKMGYDEGDVSELYQTANGNSENDYDTKTQAILMEDAQAIINEARNRILQNQEDEQYEIWSKKTYV